jgi:hypothetical protein
MTKVTSKTLQCPNCGSDWRDKPIPKEYRENYSAPYWFVRQIAIYDRDADATICYMCPDCNSRFDRG